MAPDALDRPSSEDVYVHEKGARPLHLACINADCPDSIIKLLLESYPDVAKIKWKDEYSPFPLHCYLLRVRVIPSWGYEDENGDYIEEIPALPTGLLDSDMVKLLVEAHPPALTCNLKMSALKILCEGCSVSLDLAQLLTDKENLVLTVDGRDSPLWSLLLNDHVEEFPVELF